MAIWFFHLAHGCANPLEKLPRVWQAYRSVKRQHGPTERKHSITPEMCDWLDADQRDGGLKSVIKRASRYVASIWAAVALSIWVLRSIGKRSFLSLV